MCWFGVPLVVLGWRFFRVVGVEVVLVAEWLLNVFPYLLVLPLMFVVVLVAREVSVLVVVVRVVGLDVREGVLVGGGLQERLRVLILAVGNLVGVVVRLGRAVVVVLLQGGVMRVLVWLVIRLLWLVVVLLLLRKLVVVVVRSRRRRPLVMLLLVLTNLVMLILVLVLTQRLQTGLMMMRMRTGMT